MAYELFAHPKAQRELDELPPVIADGIRRVLKEFALDPRDGRFDLKPLKAIDGEPPAMRLRVGRYRVILRIHREEKEIRIARIGHRDKVYRGLDHLD